MRCPNCNEEMVDCQAFDQVMIRPEPEEQRSFWSLTLNLPAKTGLSRNAKVCPGCGLLFTFVKDPTIFRPNLPRPADGSAVDTTTLPRPADGSVVDTTTLPRPAEEQ